MKETAMDELQTKFQEQLQLQEKICSDYGYIKMLFNQFLELSRSKPATTAAGAKYGNKEALDQLKSKHSMDIDQRSKIEKYKIETGRDPFDSSI